MDAVEDQVLHLVGSPFTFVAVALVLAVGGVVMVLPSQTLVVAVAALLVARREPAALPVLALAAGTGMVAGDLSVYGLTRGARHLEHARAPHPQRALRRLVAPAEGRVRALADRFRRAPLRTMVVARFIPTGRAASDLLAGDSGIPLRRFLRLSTVAAVCWAVYCVALGALAGPLARRYPLAITVAVVVVSLVAGLLVERIDARLHARGAAQGA